MILFSILRAVTSIIAAVVVNEIVQSSAEDKTVGIAKEILAGLLSVAFVTDAVH